MPRARRDDTGTGQDQAVLRRPFKASAMFSRRTCGIPEIRNLQSSGSNKRHVDPGVFDADAPSGNALCDLICSQSVDYWLRLSVSDQRRYQLADTHQQGSLRSS